MSETESAGDRPASIKLAQYEFTIDQNRELNRLTEAMRFAIVSLVAGGVSYFTYGIYTLFWLNRFAENYGPPTMALVVVTFCLGGVLLLASLMLTQAARSFHNIVVTEGTDINHLMKALTDLGNFFFSSLFLAWLLILGLFYALVQHRLQM